MRVSNDVSFAEILTRFGEKNALPELGQYEVVLDGQEKAANPLYKLTDFVKENSVRSSPPPRSPLALRVSC